MVVEVLFQEVIYMLKEQMSDPVKFKALVEAAEAHHVRVSNIVCYVCLYPTCTLMLHEIELCIGIFVITHRNAVQLFFQGILCLRKCSRNSNFHN